MENIEIPASFVKALLRVVEELMVVAPIAKPDGHIKLVYNSTSRITKQKSELVYDWKGRLIEAKLIAEPPGVQKYCGELDNEAHNTEGRGYSLCVESHIKPWSSHYVMDIGLIRYLWSGLNQKEIQNEVVYQVTRWNQHSLIMNILRIQEALQIRKHA